MFPEKRQREGKIAPKFKELERVHTANVKCVYVGITPDSSETKELYFTPVNSELSKNAQKLGDCLHAQQMPPNPKEFREWLDIIAQELRIACSGTLLTPPLIKNETPPQIEMNVEFRTESESQNWYSPLADFENITVTVEYLDHPPKEYLCEMDKVIVGN